MWRPPNSASCSRPATRVGALGTRSSSAHALGLVVPSERGGLRPAPSPFLFWFAVPRPVQATTVAQQERRQQGAPTWTRGVTVPTRPVRDLVRALVGGGVQRPRDEARGIPVATLRPVRGGSTEPAGLTPWPVDGSATFGGRVAGPFARVWSLCARVDAVRDVDKSAGGGVVGGGGARTSAARRERRERAVGQRGAPVRDTPTRRP